MRVRVSALVALFALLAVPLRADALAEQWIAKARAAVGSERSLDAVRSIHFTGTLETTQKVPIEGDVNNVREETLVLAIDIIFQKPFQQRMTLRSDLVVETTALDDYDGWVRRASTADESKWQLSLLDSQQVRRLRANTWENLAFFKGLERRGGKVEFGGEVQVDGRECVKLTFAHSETIIFTRYFDKVSGALVKTETESGGEIREEGEMLVNGLRFPRKLINHAPNGQVATITFEKVVLNELFGPEVFAVPTLLPNH